ncbi:DUF294 nucleotidyltransferase-like domain-containing protein [Roseovarius aestuariivivens]|uniref:DUF294 nucleotidyltransferase-like domain-containing protein n=1 Tax=Roseovarius aestuariivivens TaxID=1888910 RepID=UPI001FDABD42|nr:DUF294 nucleotidyltransferase-like domain-containing protein [Roseovarius aestuariivivens]
MTRQPDDIPALLRNTTPYTVLPPERLEACAAAMTAQSFAEDEIIYDRGQPLDGLYLIRSGSVEITDAHGQTVSLLGAGNSFGERGLSGDGRAVTTARCVARCEVLILPAEVYAELVAEFPEFERFFSKRDLPQIRKEDDLSTRQIEVVMSARPVTIAPEATAQEAARLMRERRISSLCVTRGDAIVGILSVRDLSGKLVAEGRDPSTPVAELMTPDPMVLPPSAIISDALHLMMERRIAHVPVVAGDKLVGIVSQTDLMRMQSTTSSELVAGIARAGTAKEIAGLTARIPELLVQLVAGGRRHDIATRLITDIADAATRRLIRLAEEELGPPPARYLWLACGSQGRREQTGVSDQDNCLILEDGTAPDHAYFRDLAQFVSDGLNTAGYVYCPGDMMATNDRWRQPLSIWKKYFRGWIETPNPEAQMLASVMFDLRPIAGDTGLFGGLQRDTLEAAAKNSIFFGHMVSNSLKHSAPLGLLGGLATIRSGEHKSRIDMKHNGVVPIVDLGRLFALKGRLDAVNTRARLEAARAAGLLSSGGGADLLDAYDLIASLRLEHQAGQIRSGAAPDNYLPPAGLSDFERSHLRNAFVVVKTMQSALGHGNILT